MTTNALASMRVIDAVVLGHIDGPNQLTRPLYKAEGLANRPANPLMTL